MHIAVIGTGVVGTCTAAWLQRDGHQVTFFDPLEPGESCSFGNAGSLSPSACLPVGMPGMWKRVPQWLLDPLGPLIVRWRYAPVVLPWLISMLRHSSREEVTRIARALRNRKDRALWWMAPSLRQWPAQSPCSSFWHTTQRFLWRPCSDRLRGEFC
jgi:D-amino-acid dehydrogenase